MKLDEINSYIKPWGLDNRSIKVVSGCFRVVLQARCRRGRRGELWSSMIPLVSPIKMFFFYMGYSQIFQNRCFNLYQWGDLHHPYIIHIHIWEIWQISEAYVEIWFGRAIFSAPPRNIIHVIALQDVAVFAVPHHDFVQRSTTFTSSRSELMFTS